MVVLATGCAHDVRKATARRKINVGSGEGSTGYAEFYSAGDKAVIPIYQLDSQGSPHLVSAVGLAPGDRYDFDRSQSVVAQRLTVAAPAGTQQFLIDGEGPLVKVPVAEGKVTPVPIHYNLLERGHAFVLYSADYSVLPPVEETSGGK